MSKTALNDAIRASGNQNRLARKLKVTRQAVTNWKRRGFVPDVNYAAVLEIAKTVRK